MVGEVFHYITIKKYNKHKHVVIGKMDQVCQFCDAKKLRELNILLAPLEVPPPELFRHMTGETPELKHFL